MTGSNLCLYCTITATLIVQNGLSAHQQFEVKGKVALITGGSSGIGLGSVTELLMNGARGVTIVDIKINNGKQAAKNLNIQYGSNKVIFIPADVSNQTQLESAFQISNNYWKGLDIVINNAGILNEYNWKSTIDVNIMGVLHGTFSGFKYMSKQNEGRGGVIINISSIAGIDPVSFVPVYSGTKDFVVGLGHSLGHPSYYEYNDIRIMTICPGTTHTELGVSTEDFVTNNLSPMIKEFTAKSLETFIYQPVSHLAKGILHTITYGESGSVWVIEDSRPPYEISFPDRHSMIKEIF